ncbi:hypothetical protein LTR16_005090 [Cryomyces antarcticus]|uniref:Uncharacterized protein n=1 Tax=Cryomyces antarcticus TaxID=329879 RepID=A0ABR0M5M5_9PEZI|nr:hypothetical protein LTR16_005090 [Cryomyces antarcticus]
MPIRNPFRKVVGGVEADENARPTSRGGAAAPDRGSQKTDVVGSKPTSAVNINKEPTEYKLSERKTFWHSKSTVSTTSSNHRSVLSENEPFNISRESFDSYRRSFDISARSPIPDPDVRPRQSLDMRRVPVSRASVARSRVERPETTAEEGFEDVGLNDEVKPKKRGLFARFGDSSETSANTPADAKPTSSHHGFFMGRKRGQSGQGAELGNINGSDSSHAPEVKVDS